MEPFYLLLGIAALGWWSKMWRDGRATTSYILDDPDAPPPSEGEASSQDEGGPGMR